MFNLTAPVMCLTLTLPRLLAKSLTKTIHYLTKPHRAGNVPSAYSPKAFGENLTASPLFTDFFKFNRLVCITDFVRHISIISILVIFNNLTICFWQPAFFQFALMVNFLQPINSFFVEGILTTWLIAVLFGILTPYLI